MSKRVLADQQLRSAYSALSDSAMAARELVAQLGDGPAGAVVFFASPAQDADRIAAALGERFPAVPLIGCTTAGEFTDRRTATGGVSAAVLPAGLVRRTASALADHSAGVEEGVAAAVARMEGQLGMALREADPRRYVGLVLMDGTHATEERVNELLGNAAPLLSFVGGSAGDDLAFVSTRVFCGSSGTDNGAALAILELTAPFTVFKTCSFEPTGRRFTITAADPLQRVVWEFDGRPAAEMYAEAVGYPVEEIQDRGFMSHPVGLVIDGKPWIRSPQRVIDGRGIMFYCQILPGMEVELMRSTDLIGDTQAALSAAVAEVGGTASGALMFNCILRRLELDAQGLNEAFVGAIADIPTAGFHTYGESWLGHMNQTLTGIMFGHSK
jgi:hypothetical protein